MKTLALFLAGVWLIGAGCALSKKVEPVTQQHGLSSKLSYGADKALEHGSPETAKVFTEEQLKVTGLPNAKDMAEIDALVAKAPVTYTLNFAALAAEQRDAIKTIGEQAKREAAKNANALREVNAQLLQKQVVVDEYNEWGGLRGIWLCGKHLFYRVLALGASLVGILFILRCIPATHFIFDIIIKLLNLIWDVTAKLLFVPKAKRI